MWKLHEIKNAPIILGFPPRSTFVTWIPPNWQSPSQISLIWSKVTVLGSNFNPCLVVIPTKNESSRAKSLLLMCSWQTLRLFVTLSHGWSRKDEEFANGANTAIQWGLSEPEDTRETLGLFPEVKWLFDKGDSSLERPSSKVPTADKDRDCSTKLQPPRTLACRTHCSRDKILEKIYLGF